MDSRSRRSFATLLVILGGAWNSSAIAADYRVEFGAETPTGKDAATLECRFSEICSGKLESLNLTVSIYAVRSKLERAYINLDGSDLSCCLFAGAADSITVNLRRPLSRVPFFKGIRAKGGLFIENERAGMLYIRFNLSRDRI
jgi:hypothetical protein